MNGMFHRGWLRIGLTLSLAYFFIFSFIFILAPLSFNRYFTSFVPFSYELRSVYDAILFPSFRTLTFGDGWKYSLRYLDDFREAEKIKLKTFYPGFWNIRFGDDIKLDKCSDDVVIVYQAEAQRSVTKMTFYKLGVSSEGYMEQFVPAFERGRNCRVGWNFLNSADFQRKDPVLLPVDADYSFIWKPEALEVALLIISDQADFIFKERLLWLPRFIIVMLAPILLLISVFSLINWIKKGFYND